MVAVLGDHGVYRHPVAAADDNLDRLLARLRELIREERKFTNFAILSDTVRQSHWARYSAGFPTQKVLDLPDCRVCRMELKTIRSEERVCWGGRAKSAHLEGASTG